MGTWTGNTAADAPKPNGEWVKHEHIANLDRSLPQKTLLGCDRDHPSPVTLAVDSVERVGEAIRSVLGIFRDSSYFEQRVYDLDALMMTVRGLHQVAPEHPLGLKTLRSPVEKAQETDDILSFYYGLAALDELHQP